MAIVVALAIGPIYDSGLPESTTRAPLLVEKEKSKIKHNTQQLIPPTPQKKKQNVVAQSN